MIDALAEEHIQVALRNGEFDDLPGHGQPLVLDDDSAVPEALRVGYRLLRNAGCLPPAQELQREIQDVGSLLYRVETEAEALPIRRRLHWLETRLAMQGREVNLLLQEAAYREKLLGKLTRDADC
jgi:hypothetical protein